MDLYFDGDVKRIYEVPTNSTFAVVGGNHRLYTPVDIPSAPTETEISTVELWSKWVDWHYANQWSTLAFSKSGGTFRFNDAQGNPIYQTFDLRLLNDWRFAPADYAHSVTIRGNLFPNDDGSDFCTTYLTAQGVSPRVFFSDSLQTLGAESAASLAAAVRAELAAELGLIKLIPATI